MTSAIKPNQILYRLMLRKEGHRSPLEWRWQKPSTSISLLRLRMRPRYPFWCVYATRRGDVRPWQLGVCEDEVYKVLFNLNPSKAPGPGGLPTIVLKSRARELTTSLCGLFNSSLAEDKLATEWKDALVILVHKKGKKEDVTNYRPISLLCVVSKVLERCIFKHFEEFLCPLFHNAQHGFFQGRSTVTQIKWYYNVVAVVRAGLHNTRDRRRAEGRLIFKCKTLQPRGINIDFNFIWANSSSARFKCCHIWIKWRAFSVTASSTDEGTVVPKRLDFQTF